MNFHQKHVHFKKTLEPFFTLNGWDIDITFKELYELTNIEYNLYVTNFNSMTSEIFNYKTQPDLSVIKAAVCSAAIPPVVSPFIIDNKLYVDGGLLANNPIKQALEIIDSSEHDNILGFNIFQNYI